MSYLDWHVGMKVVCVDDTPSLIRQSGLEVGRVYTIIKIGRDRRRHHLTGRTGNFVVIEVAEASHPTAGSYGAIRFRPVQTRKTDISIFTAMLDGSRQKERA